MGMENEDTARDQPEPETVQAEPEDDAAAVSEPEPEDTTCSTVEEAPDTDGGETDRIQTLIEMLAASQEALARANEQIAALSKLVESRLKHAEHLQGMVDDMRDELHRFRDDQYFKLIRPAIRDVIEIRESMSRTARALVKKEGRDCAIPVTQFVAFIDDFENMLAEYEIECCRSQPGDEFTAGRQTCIRKIPTGDASMHRKIAESLGDGYIYGGKVLFAERVSAYVYDDSLSDEGEMAPVPESKDNDPNS